jgi:peptide/nickel transport system ATP-binding protein
MTATPLLEVAGLSKTFVATSLLGRRIETPVLRNVSLRVRPGASLGLVGESGSGKSTLVRCILGLERPDSGQVLFKGKSILDPAGRHRSAGEIQPIFQNPASSLNPHRRVAQIIGEPLAVHSKMSREERMAEVHRLLDLVALPRSFVDRYPGQLSGGQCQRVSIARALALRPPLIIADEATSALDVLVQRQVMDLLLQLKAEMRMAMLFVSHNLAVTNIICDEIAVMWKGEIVESGFAGDVIRQPSAEYTRNLIRAVPILSASGPQARPSQTV